jgi:hypothetical protein
MDLALEGIRRREDGPMRTWPTLVSSPRLVPKRGGPCHQHAYSRRSLPPIPREYCH